MTIKKFLSHVEKKNGHWYWTGALDKDGYGISWDGQRKVPAHVLSYRYFKTDFNSALYTLHKCDIRNCVNPDCLYQGTQKDNIKDCVAKGRHKETRKTHCKMGHPLNGDNVRITSRGWRECLICRQARIVYDNSLTKMRNA